VSVALLCNKLVAKRFILILGSWQSFENIIPKTPQRKRSFDQRKRIKNRQTVCCKIRAVLVAASLRLPRLRIVVRKLKIASRGAVPFGHGEIVLIDRI
jgi:hypothetical protein